MRVKTAVLAALVGGFLAVASTAWSIPITLTFDELPFQAVHGVSIQGVTFSFTIGGNPSSEAHYNDLGPGNITFLNDPSLVGLSVGELTLDFAVPITHLEFGVALLFDGATPAGATVELFDAALTSLGLTSVATHPLITWSEARFAYTGPAVSRAVITFDSSAGELFALDNLTTVPEPSTLFLLGTGVLVFLGCKVRRVRCLPWLLVAALVFGSTSGVPMVFATPKVILISLDGATPSFVEAFLADGSLALDEGLGLLKTHGVSAKQNITVTPSLTAFADTNPLYTFGGSLPIFEKVFRRPLPKFINSPNFGLGTDTFIGQDSGDVFALPRPGYNFDGTQSPVVQRQGDAVSSTPILSVPNFYGAHGHYPYTLRMSAIFYGAGPDITSARLGWVRNIDVAPTILHILGVAPASTVEGRALPVGR